MPPPKGSFVVSRGLTQVPLLLNTVAVLVPNLILDLVTLFELLASAIRSLSLLAIVAVVATVPMLLILPCTWADNAKSVASPRFCQVLLLQIYSLPAASITTSPCAGVKLPPAL